MTESKRGIFQRGSAPFIEVEAARSDDYMTFARKAADCCQLRGDSGYWFIPLQNEWSQNFESNSNC